MAGTGVFVGWEGELSRLQSALAERARLVLVVGGAGIGKSRFVAAGLARARTGGLVAVSGGCLPLAEKLPLLPVADALAELSRTAGGARFDAALTAVPAYVRPEVARLLPRLAGDASEVGPAEGWRHERLFAAVAELLGGDGSSVGPASRAWRIGLRAHYAEAVCAGTRNAAVSAAVSPSTAARCPAPASMLSFSK
jgi:AAA ATPase domain